MHVKYKVYISKYNSQVAVSSCNIHHMGHYSVKLFIISPKSSVKFCCIVLV